MNDLIKIESRELSGETVQTVNARDLWEFVESKRDFSTWIKFRIEQYGLVEGIDFIAPQKNGAQESKSYGQDRIDYHLTIETGKELAMVENNDKGRQVRRYFIECERKAKEQPAFQIPQTLSGALMLAAKQAA